MSSKKVKYKPNEVIKHCPKCKNNTQFTVYSEQVCEDSCDTWVECKCGYDPTSYDNLGSMYRLESVWGGTSDEDCEDAIRLVWNECIEEIESKANTQTTK